MRPTVTVTEKTDKRIEATLKELLRKSDVRVGYWRGENQEADGTDLVVVARVNEFGATIPVTAKMKAFLAWKYNIYIKKNTIKIPQRSFLRSTVDQNRTKLDRMIEGQLRAVAHDKKSMSEAIAAIGVFAVALVKSKISKSASWAVPNSDMTKMIKGLGKNQRRKKGDPLRGQVSQPLVRSGELRNKVDYKAEVASK
jgi:hypothetical protein